MENCKTCESVLDGYSKKTCPDCGITLDWYEGQVIAIETYGITKTTCSETNGFSEETQGVFVQLTYEEWAIVLAARIAK